MYKTLISTKNLREILYEENIIIFDCRFDLAKKNTGYTDYLNSHIDGAFYINLESDLSSKLSLHSGRHPLKDITEFSNILNSFGINKNTQIFVYDEENSSMCARFWWMLKLVGLENCAVLDGGYNEWLRMKYPINNYIPKKLKKENINYSYNHKKIVTTKDLKELLVEPSVCLLDARDPDRFSGKIEPIDKKAGHVPGAINVPFKKNLNEDGTFKNIEELRSNFKKAIKQNKTQIINMCGSGVTACHNLLAMEHCGIKNSKIYVGSWSAWSSYEDATISGEKL